MAFHELNYVVLMLISRRNYGKQNQEVLNVKKLVGEAVSFKWNKNTLCLRNQTHVEHWFCATVQDIEQRLVLNLFISRKSSGYSRVWCTFILCKDFEISMQRSYLLFLRHHDFSAVRFDSSGGVTVSTDVIMC